MRSRNRLFRNGFGGALAIAALITTFLAAPTAAPPARADNPIVTTVYTADPAPLVHNGRVYVYTGHDEDTATNWFDMRDWRVYSSADMVNWTDHGSPLSLATFSWASANAWAGHVIERNGKFYYYVPVTDRATNQFAIGVAVSESPTGPFRDALGHALLTNTEIDPAAFIDDNGQAYLYWGNPNLWYVRLNPDMISFSGGPTQIPLTTAGYGTRIGNAQRSTLFEEAPWIYKRNGTYYNLFAAECCAEYLAYSTAPSPTGPWSYRGTVMTREGGTGTNHAGVVDFKGNSYIFYQNASAPGGDGFHRSVAVERFTYGADGSIATIPMTASGPPQLEPLNPYLRQEAETMAAQVGLETEASTEGALNVWNIENGDWLKVKGVGFGAGATSFSARVASAAAGGTLEFHLDSPTGPLAGQCTVPNTGGWQTWATVTCGVGAAVGTRDVFFRFVGGTGHLFNFNSWQFAANTTAYTVTNRNSGKAMDVQSPNLNDRAAIGQWSSNGQPWQRWRFTDAGKGYVTLQSVNSGKCADVVDFSTTDGARLIQWACHAGTNQQFEWRSTATSGFYNLVNRNSGKCIGVAGASLADGALLEQRTCSTATNLQWARG